MEDCYSTQMVRSKSRWSWWGKRTRSAEDWTTYKTRKHCSTQGGFDIKLLFIFNYLVNFKLKVLFFTYVFTNKEAFLSSKCYSYLDEEGNQSKKAMKGIHASTNLEHAEFLLSLYSRQPVQAEQVRMNFIKKIGSMAILNQVKKALNPFFTKFLVTDDQVSILPLQKNDEFIWRRKNPLNRPFSGPPNEIRNLQVVYIIKFEFRTNCNNHLETTL